MDNETDLVTGRLRYVMPDGPKINVNKGSNTSYSASRLGLVPRIQRPAPPVEKHPEPKIAYKKSTYKLPEATIARVKAYANLTEQFQYNVVSDAVRQYLDRVVSMMGYQERSQMVELTKQYLEESDLVVPEPLAEEDLPQAPSEPRNDAKQAETPCDVEPAASHSPHWLSMLRKIGQIGG